MKTIAELNDKWWYRALKVVYVVFASICYLIATIGIGAYISWVYDEHKEYLRDYAQYQTQYSTYLVESKKTDFETLKKEWLADDNFDFSRFGTIIEPDEPIKPNTTLRAWGTLPMIIFSYFFAWFITMLPRWSFYYIALGSLRPSLGEDIRDTRFKDLLNFIQTKGVWFVEAVIVLMFINYGLSFVFKLLFGIVIVKGNIHSPAMVEFLKDTSNTLPFILALVAGVSFYRTRKSKNQKITS